MTLSEIETDSIVIIKGFQSGRRLQNRLISMGVLIGSKIKVVKSAPKSPITIKVKDTTLTIGYGMATKILVEIF